MGRGGGRAGPWCTGQRGRRGAEGSPAPRRSAPPRPFRRRWGGDEAALSNVRGAGRAARAPARRRRPRAGGGGGRWGPRRSRSRAAMMQ